MPKDKFMFFPNFKAMADKLDDGMRLKFYDALTNYVFHDIQPDDPIISALLEAIKPSLDKVDGRQNNGGNHNPNGVNQHSKVGQSGQIRSKLVNSGQSLSETETETEVETETKEKEISNDISKKKNNQIDYQNDIQIDNQNEKPKSKFNENSIIYVNGQYFDEFPPESMPLLKKHWSLEELEDIRKRMAFKPEHQTTVAQMLVEYPPKPKTTRFVKPTVEEIETYCKERNNNVDAHKFYNHYESNGWKVGKNPMKDWKAAIRTWEKNNFEQPKKEKINFSFYTGEGSFLKPDGEW